MSNDKAYYNAMQEAIRRDRLLLEQDYARLKARNAQLEQLCKDMDGFIGELNSRYGYGTIREAEKQSLQRRAKALLEQEVN